MVRGTGERRRPRRRDDAFGPPTSVPIAAGESEFTRFDFVDLVERGIADVLQPDLAICGGPTEGRRIAALAESHQLELAPHCWGSALSFAAGTSLAFASPAARVIEFSLGANPFLHELFGGVNLPVDGVVAPPSSPGFGCDPVPEIVDRYTYRRCVRIRRDRSSPMKMIHHVNVAVDDLASATEFYRDVIGLDPIATPDLGFPAQFFSIAAGPRVACQPTRRCPPAAGPLLHTPRRLRRCRRASRGHGCDRQRDLGPATRIGTGVIQLFVRDPAGNLIELNSLPGERVRRRVLRTTLRRSRVRALTADRSSTCF